jgi:23S rRNA (guanosine2251-2'-O)-methyltransferase
MDNNNKEKFHENYIEGRNAVLEAFRSGKTIDKLFVLDGCQDGPIKSITREARKHDAIINYVAKERLDQMSETGKHQGVIAVSAAYEYAEKKKRKLLFPHLASSVQNPRKKILV